MTTNAATIPKRRSSGGCRPDYISIRQQSDLASASDEGLHAGEPLVILIAAKIGKTRLTDNLEI